MGASESLPLPRQREQQHQQQLPIDEITTVSERIAGVDPILHRLRALKIVTLSLSLDHSILSCNFPIFDPFFGYSILGGTNTEIATPDRKQFDRYSGQKALVFLACAFR